MSTTSPQILLTNDDGIQSPGLWAAAETLSEIGYVHVVAPREQSTGMGRSLPGSSDGIITPQKIVVNGKEWTVYAVGGSPAQAVQHAVIELMPARPALVVSGINYGENLGTGVTISGTVGAALEAAAMDIPAIAVSLETAKQYHLSYSNEVDFSAAAHFTRFFAQLTMDNYLPKDVDVLKIDVPMAATADTPWRITRLSRKRYYHASPPQRVSWDTPTHIGYQQAEDLTGFAPDTDVYAMCVAREISVTPLSLDMTSRIGMQTLAQTLGKLVEDKA